MSQIVSRMSHFVLDKLIEKARMMRLRRLGDCPLHVAVNLGGTKMTAVRPILILYLLCRRSNYIAVRRNFLSPFMLTFGRPVLFSSTGRRNLSNVPTQVLTISNEPLVAELSHA
ncbi:DUF1553 domain-containing protein [Roseiconus lacunae]|uniref:DUF1553 domain-containing protein n=1 Tax=Roseiconus lacunae TaxID=2605694 RepID=UPI003F5307C3